MPSKHGMRKCSIISDNELIAEISFKRVSKYQTGQIISLTLAFAFSTAACLTLSYVNYVLNPDCLLFAKWIKIERNDVKVQTSRRYSVSISMSNETSTTPMTLAEISKGWLYGEYSADKPMLELAAETKWGRKRHCYVTQYGFAAAAVASFILCWFFVFFRPTREAYVLKKKTAASKLVVPAIIFCVAFVICVFVAAITLQVGVADWCSSVTEILHRCSMVSKYAVTWAGKATYIDFWSVLLASQILSWFGAIVWLISLIMLVQRLYRHVDFPAYFFKSFSANHDQRIQSETDSD